MEDIVLFIDAIVALSNAMAFYILFGLLFAGILHEMVPETLVSKHLGKDSIASVIKATLFGIPLPVCSCGVIPLAASIKKNGASNGATLSFLISTPITGVDSILATYGIFGWAFTIYRVVTSIIISMIAGIITNLKAPGESKNSQPLFTMAHSKPVNPSTVLVSALPNNENCSAGDCGCGQPKAKKRFSFIGAMHYAFVTLLRDIAKPLLFGLIIGALITVAIPKNLSDILITYHWISYLIVVAIAIPMYVCATASLPIAAGLMLAGVSPGAAFVFLSAGPATNTVTIGVVKKMMGTQILTIYLVTIGIGSILFGFGLDYLLDGVNVNEIIHIDENPGLIEWISSTILWGFVLYFIAKPYIRPSKIKNTGDKNNDL
ncbi:MAG: SO_0444 family Cu/Zn efflux transporter [Sulfuricurvum sp.]|uniref:SO_0444 family Cu/Zn efflux transporter n=1 Tax=Sulfuricurvum sp. TaxID=2025608 RepID=UPI002610A9AD|nr:SO_0444 family Cu/Zn efflux transporter [Sulfuricurvum sp.]MDD5160748.1 SO_0444 family Cu/Zn efflux transporter [Sulfuricurvum sp.]